MHSWGEADKQGRDICARVDEAAYYIDRFISKWGRITVAQSKEKFGTVRVYLYWGWSSIHAIVFPRQMWIHKWWPSRLDFAICKFLMPVLLRVTEPYRKWIYRLGYKRAINLWPDLKEEILCCSDYPEFLEGL